MKKNIEFNKAVIDSILYGGLTLVLIASAFGCKKTDSKKNGMSTMNSGIMSNSEATDEDLDQYIAKRYELQQEIESLLKQKEKLQDVKTFYLDNLIVVEVPNRTEETNLYILNAICGGPDYEEYHNLFKANQLELDTGDLHDLDSRYVHFYSAQPLFHYLTDEEQERLSNNNGKITTLQLDEILVRMRVEYQEKNQTNHNSKTLISQ